MNDLLDRIDTDPLAALRPQSARENERALAFAMELTEGSPALDAVRGRGILASMIAEQRVQLEERARSIEQARTGFSRPSHRATPGGRSVRVSAEGSFSLPATLRPGAPQSSTGSRISANAQYADQYGQNQQHDQGLSMGEARARAMSSAPAAMLGNSVRGPQGQRLRTVDAPAYGRTAGQAVNRTATRSAGGGAGGATIPAANYVTSGALALADPDFVRHPRERTHGETTTARPSLRVLSGGKVAGNTRKKVLVVLAVVALVTVAFAAVFMHAGLARTQLGIDKLNIEITQAERMNQRLRVQVATLEAPDRIVSVAQELGLEPPKTVRFLPTAAPIALAATRIVR